MQVAFATGLQRIPERAAICSDPNQRLRSWLDFAGVSVAVDNDRFSYRSDRGHFCVTGAVQYRVLRLSDCGFPDAPRLQSG